MTAAVTGGNGFARALTEALRTRGVDATRVDATFGSRVDAAAALGDVRDLSAVVHVCGDEVATVVTELTDTDARAWEHRCERLIGQALFALQAAHDALAGSGGRIVVVTATTGVPGAPGVVPFVTATEGVRALAKSAARQWGTAGITVNTVLVPVELIDRAAAPLTSFLPPPALGAMPAIEDVATAVQWFSEPDAVGITGASVVVDGGAVMVP